MSSDFSKTWRQIRLAQTRSTGEIVVYPQNPDLVYVTFFEIHNDGVATIPVDFQGCL